MMKVLLLFLVVPFVSGDKVVLTTNGPIRGTSLAPKKVEAFLGIPYAKPPVGALRFAKPVSKSPWEEIYDADKFPASCIQLNRVPKPELIFPGLVRPNPKMSEDCLYLNIWVPEGGSERKTIMLFIHGGGFMWGASTWKVIDGANLSEHGDVIVVTINYRVGSLGFFSGFIEEAPGNMGMYDQIMAIQWIKDNAQNFGGDPDNIVLFGESAGAISVSLHMLSPLSKNLFKRAILQSGSGCSPLFSKENEMLSMSQEIASLLGCAKENDSLEKNPKRVVDCMKKLPSKKFSEADKIFNKGFRLLFPRVGEGFLPENAIDSFKKGDFKDTELLLGVTRDEGTLFLLYKIPEIIGSVDEEGNLSVDDTKAREYLEKLAKFGNSEKERKIVDGYIDLVKKEPNYTYLNALSDIYGDYLITCGSIFQAEYHSLKKNPVYFYRFDYRTVSSPLPEWMGVIHFEETQYIFGNPLMKEFTEQEKELSRDVMDMWVAFAKTGNPNIPQGIEWPRYTFQEPKYLQIGEKDRIGLRPDNSRCEIFRELFQSVIDEDTMQKLEEVD